MQVRNRITGRTFSAPPTYSVQGRSGERFMLKGEYWKQAEAVAAAKAAFDAGGYVEVTVQDTRRGTQVASFKAEQPGPLAQAFARLEQADQNLADFREVRASLKSDVGPF